MNYCLVICFIIFRCKIFILLFPFVYFSVFFFFCFDLTEEKRAKRTESSSSDGGGERGEPMEVGEGRQLPNRRKKMRHQIDIHLHGEKFYFIISFLGFYLVYFIIFLLMGTYSLYTLYSFTLFFSSQVGLTFFVSLRQINLV